MKGFTSSDKKNIDSRNAFMQIRLQPGAKVSEDFLIFIGIIMCTGMIPEGGQG